MGLKGERIPQERSSHKEVPASGPLAEGTFQQTLLGRLQHSDRLIATEVVLLVFGSQTIYGFKG